MRAARATVVVPGLFALAHQVIGNIQVATFAAFGGFATLVMAGFEGTRRDKLVAHTGLALAGSVLLTIGTAVASSTAVAAVVTVPVTFVVFFAGIASPNAAAGVTAALLGYVLPAASPGTISMVPDRLAGWWLASVAGTVAVLLLSPPLEVDGLRRAAAKLSSALADRLLDALRGVTSSEGLTACLEAKDELMTMSIAAPYRPTGLATADQGLANTVEMLEWCAALVADGLDAHGDLREAEQDDHELLQVAAATLHDVASLLRGTRVGPDLEALERARAQAAGRLSRPLPPREISVEGIRSSVHNQTIALAVRSIAADARIASRVADPETIAAQRQRWYGSWPGRRERAPRLAGAVSAASFVRRHASLRSVWFVNSARGALALAAAVAVADLSNVQHGFWVVLGTLSVLRTNAASTGSTAARALLGTVIGFAIGGTLILAIGTSTTALWISLPIAVLVAAYAPGTAPFAVGQAAFTVVVSVLFNLLVPVGWDVGVVRIEDVALGCAVSVVVGTLFWPRGISGVVGNDLADAFRVGGSYLVQAVEWALGRRGAEPDTAIAATTTGIRLDDALRGFLAEQGAKRISRRDLWKLVGGSLRLRLTAQAVAALPHGVVGVEPGRTLRERAQLIAAWCEQIAVFVGPPRSVTNGSLDPQPLGDADALSGSAQARRSSSAIQVDEHLDHLSQYLALLVEPVTHLAEVRRRPWWR